MSICCQADTDRTDNWAGFCGFPDSDGNVKESFERLQSGTAWGIVSRDNFLLAAGVAAVVAGFLFPWSHYVLDVFLIFNVSLTAAVLIVAFSAREISQIQGLPLLIVLATTMRIALGAACSRLVLSRGAAGTIITLVTDSFAGSGYVFAVLTSGGLILVCFGIICRAVRDIINTGSDFVCDVAPLRQKNIDGSINAGGIGENEAIGFRKKIAQQTGFFVAMTGISRFMVCAAVIELVIIIVGVVGGMVAGITLSANTALSAKTYIALAAAAGAITQVPALLIAVASRAIVHRSFASAVAEKGIGEDSVCFASVLLCEEGENTDACGEPAECRTDIQPCDKPKNIPAAKPDTGVRIDKVVSGDLEWIDEKPDDCWSAKKIKENSSYEAIAELVESRLTGATKTILMAAESIGGLGVTVPVNVAMQLVRRTKRCLLIDLDCRRNAISKVFDIDGVSYTDTDRKTAISTCVEGLWVWPARNFAEEAVSNLKGVIAGLESWYDCIIVYAPNINVLRPADYDKIAGCVQGAMIFGGDCLDNKSGGPSVISDFHRRLIDCGCIMFEPAEVFSGVL